MKRLNGQRQREQKNTELMKRETKHPLESISAKDRMGEAV